MRINGRVMDMEMIFAAAQELGIAHRGAELAVYPGTSPTLGTSMAPEGPSAGAITPREGPDGREGGESAQADLSRTVSTRVTDPEVVRTDKNAIYLDQLILKTADPQDQMGNKLR